MGETVFPGCDTVISRNFDVILDDMNIFFLITVHVSSHTTPQLKIPKALF